MPAGTYVGRLMADGEGNLLADQSVNVGNRTYTLTDENNDPVLGPDGNAIEVVVPIFKFGPDHGKPLRYHEGSYVFLNPGEPSHNEVYHQQWAQADWGPNGMQDFIGGTVDSSMTDDPDLVNVGGGSNEHHSGALPDDPHYEEGVVDGKGIVTNTRARTSPDKTAYLETGHTEAYKEMGA